jgi:signal transduction histidine kinase
MSARRAKSLKDTGLQVAQFRVESRLLEELGERLVSSSEVALVELIKNSYDADATYCSVDWGDDYVTVSDDGHGMTPNEFLEFWMTIATSDKKNRVYSRKYSRKMSGEKGVGRFAARFLGEYLRLETVAQKPKAKTKTRLVAEFDWQKLDRAADLEELEVNYTVEHGVTDESGTTLRIEKVRDVLDSRSMKAVRTNVLGIASPFAGLDAGMYGASRSRSRDTAKDPGFAVRIAGYSDDEEESNLAKSVLDNYVARVRFKLTKNSIAVRIHFNQQDTEYKENCKFTNNIGCEVVGDIRYFPRRAGTFHGAEVDGRRAWSWVRDNSGVAVIDHGFRVPPYGAGEDDWLHLDADTVMRRRDWRTDLMHKLHPIPEEIKPLPGLNPALWLPRNQTLVGAVFIESSAAASEANKGLVPNMDRQGYLESRAFEEFRDATRFAVELIGHYDRKLAREEDERIARRNRRKARQELKVAIDEIRSAPNLDKDQKNRIINQYSDLYRNVEELENYDRNVRQNLDVMSSLGVIAGFMTHEVQRMLFQLRQTTKALTTIAKQDPKVEKLRLQLEKSEESFQAYTQFTQLFLGEGMQAPRKPYKAKYQIKNVTSTFDGIQSERGIEVEISIDDRVMAPHVPIAMYAGVALNLHTNALKAVIQQDRRKAKKISFRAWNDDKYHFLEVLDTGVGIPEKVRGRIFDPLYTTTSSLDSPLGSGMGLGLALIRRLLEGYKGSIGLVDPPDGFSTCFRVRIPLAGG